MQTEIPTPLSDVIGNPCIPRWVQDWCVRRSERTVWLTLTATGNNCAVRSGALTLEFDTLASPRAAAIEAIRRTTGRTDPLTDIPTTGPLALETGP